MVALGPEVLVHTVLLIEPSESEAEAPVGAEELVGKVITWSGPAFTEGGVLAAQTLPFQMVLPTQLEVIVSPGEFSS